MLDDAALDRRRLLRGASLAALLPAVPLLGACGPTAPDRPGGRATGSVLVVADQARLPADPSALPGAVASVHAIAAGLWSRVAGKDDNVAVSPYSIAVALGMTLNGAAGDTRREMLDVLAADSEQALNRGLNALTGHVESLARGKVALDAANQLFGQRGIGWEQAFLDVLARQYGAGLRAVDFVGAAEDARASVNAWTAGHTRNRITKLLPPGSVDRLTRLVLVNALYFKAPWLEPFEDELTRPGDFHLRGGTTTRVPMMHAVLEAAASATGDGWTAVRLPYAGGRLAMTVVLPEGDREVDIADLPAILAAPQPGGVDLTMPRWTFRTEVALAEPLADLGMPSAFDERRADLSRMTADEGLVIDDVHHQVFVAVDERGTEAAAATAVAVRATSVSTTRLTAVLDRPFVFVIHDVQHGTPLFVGRMGDPRA
jgi:serine protease inhibitor